MGFRLWLESLAGVEYDAQSDETGKIQMNATLGGQPVGYAILRPMGDQGWEMNHVHVEPQYRRQGVGMEIYRRCAAYVGSRGGRLYTSTQQTDLGKSVHNKMWKSRWLGGLERKDGGFRHEINPGE